MQEHIAMLYDSWFMFSKSKSNFTVLMTKKLLCPSPRHDEGQQARHQVRLPYTPLQYFDGFKSTFTLPLPPLH